MKWCPIVGVMGGIVGAISILNKNINTNSLSWEGITITLRMMMVWRGPVHEGLQSKRREEWNLSGGVIEQ